MYNTQEYPSKRRDINRKSIFDQCDELGIKPSSGIKILTYGFSKITDRSHVVPARAFWRIYWNPTPGGYVEDKFRKYYLDKSKVIAIPPGLPIEQGMSQPFKSFHLHVDAGRILGSYSEILFIPADRELLGKLEFIIKQMSIGKEMFQSDPFIELFFYSYIYSVFTHLNRDLIEFRVPDHRIEKVINLLEKSLKSGINNVTLAKKAGMGTNSFIRFFKNETGKTPQAYLLSLRLEESTILLACSYQTIDEISEICGFCERSYFSRLFKREYGMGPAEYRKKI